MDPMKAALLERAKREKQRRAQAPAEPQGMGLGAKVATALNNAGEALTFGLVGDEAAAKFDQMIGRGTYEDRLNLYRGNQEQFREENPGASFASEVAPMLIPGMGAANIAGRAATLGGKAARAATAGGLSGAVYGFAEGEDGFTERAKSAALSGALGAGVGAATPRITNALAGGSKKLQQMVGLAEKRPTVPMLKRVKQEAYRLVDESGEAFTPEDMTKLYVKVSDSFNAQNYVEETDNALKATLKILESRADKPSTTLSQLDGVRQNLWKRYASAKDQPQILDAIRSIDDLIESKSGASELMGAARAANSKFAKSQVIEDAFAKAADQTASTGSGGNIANKYKQAMTSIIYTPSKAKFFSAEEIDLMRGVIQGNPVQDVQRLIGKLSPEGNGLMMALHTIGGVTSGGATVPLMAVGAAAKRGADSSVIRGADRVQDVVSGMRPAQQALNPLALGAGVASAPIAEEAATGILDMFR